MEALLHRRDLCDEAVVVQEMYDWGHETGGEEEWSHKDGIAMQDGVLPL